MDGLIKCRDAAREIAVFHKSRKNKAHSRNLVHTGSRGGGGPQCQPARATFNGSLTPTPARTEAGGVLDVKTAC